MQDWFSKNREVLSRLCFLFVGVFNIIYFSLKDIVSPIALIFWSFYTCVCLGLVMRTLWKKRKYNETE